MSMRRSLALLALLQPLEPRSLLAATFTIDTTADVHPISRWIYGVNQPLTGSLANATLTRLGGNRWTAYNWENNASNAGSDYQYQNDGYLGGGETPGGAVAPTLTQAASRNAGAILTIPLAGYAAADKNGGGDVRNSGANYLSTRFNQTKPRKGSPFSLTPDTTDDVVYADEFVNWVKQNYPSAANANTPVWFSLDNEPDLWSSTHAEIHPNAVTYAELISKSIDYSKAIKDVMPGTKVLGPASYGFNGYVSLQNAPDAGDRDFLDTYLQQLHDASVTDGRRLLDVLDLHWYPEARGGGVRITENDNSAAVVAARLQAPRSLWDPTYIETSWIAQDYYHGPINLLPRLKAKIAAHYAGTDLGFSEYNFGGTNHISGGIAQADVLGIFGREGVFSANEWPLHTDESFVAGGFNMFRNYDGAGSTFGDTSIHAATSDVAGTSIYASLDSTNPNVMVLVAINKTAAANAATISLNGRRPAGNGKAYQLAGTVATPQAVGDVAIAAGANSFAYTMPAYSVTTIRVPLVDANAPRVLSSSFDVNAFPNIVRFTFDRDVHTSLSPDDLTITRATGGGAPLTATNVTWDANTRTATFTVPTNLPDGAYHATLSGAGVSAGAAAMVVDATVDFHELPGDANRDRVVEFADLLILAKNYGRPSQTFTQGNFDYSGDGVVDFNDLLILARHYGQSV